MRYKVEAWLEEMATKYPEIRAYAFDDRKWIEDNKGFYVAVTPIEAPDRKAGTVTQTDTSCSGGGIVQVLSTYYVVWRLNEITQQIFDACLIESSFLGQVRSVTTDIQYFREKMGFKGAAPGDRKFIAVEVLVSHEASRNRTKCQCLQYCTVG